MFLRCLTAVLCLALACSRSGAQTVVASIYSQHEKPWGDVTASNIPLDDSKPTCAFPEWARVPFGTKVMLYRGRNNVVATVTDFGPHVDGRTLDCTPAVDRALHLDGLGRVRVIYWPPLPQPRPESK